MIFFKKHKHLILCVSVFLFLPFLVGDPFNLAEKKSLVLAVGHNHRYFGFVKKIKEELEEQITYFRSQNKLLEAQRIEERTRFDLEMMLEIGYCHGIENYSRIMYLPDCFTPLQRRFIMTFIKQNQIYTIYQF